MLWHAQSPCSSVSGDGNYTLRWRGAGFGQWIVEAWFEATKLGEYGGLDLDEPMRKAMERCSLHAAGGVP